VINITSLTILSASLPRSQTDGFVAKPTDLFASAYLTRRLRSSATIGAVFFG
jgi:hypothetical protein